MWFLKALAGTVIVYASSILLMAVYAFGVKREVFRSDAPKNVVAWLILICCTIAYCLAACR